MKTHFQFGSSWQTSCGRRGMWIVATPKREEVTCLSCARIEVIDVKAMIAKQYRRSRTGRLGSSRIQPDLMAMEDVEE